MMKGTALSLKAKARVLDSKRTCSEHLCRFSEIRKIGNKRQRFEKGQMTSLLWSSLGLVVLTSNLKSLLCLCRCSLSVHGHGPSTCLMSATAADLGQAYEQSMNISAYEEDITCLWNQLISFFCKQQKESPSLHFPFFDFGSWCDLSQVTKMAKTTGETLLLWSTSLV